MFHFVSGHLVVGNKMDASNLATLFAPNILHKSMKELSSNDLSEEMTIERRQAIDVVTTLIGNYEYLFKVQGNIIIYVCINITYYFIFIHWLQMGLGDLLIVSDKTVNRVQM